MSQPSRGRICPSFDSHHAPLPTRGHREDRALVAPAAWCAAVVRIKTHTSIITGSTDAIRPSLRDGLRLIRDLPGVRALIATVAL